MNFDILILFDCLYKIKTIVLIWQSYCSYFCVAIGVGWQAEIMKLTNESIALKVYLQYTNAVDQNLTPSFQDRLETSMVETL